MIVYHGSWLAIPKPDCVHSRKRVDFGPGFYVTTLEEQAKRWSLRFREKKGGSVISKYELDDSVFEVARTLVFDAYDEAWLTFISGCRQGVEPKQYDLIMGGVANDRVFDTVELYLNSLIPIETALERLRIQTPSNQICLRSQEIMDKYLHYSGSETL